MTGRRYDLVHHTTYTYDDDVSDSYGRTTLQPRDLPDQTCLSTQIVVDPTPDDTAAHVDYFGNRTTYFAVTTPHRRLVVTARSQVEVRRTPPAVTDLPAVAWDEVARAVREGDGEVAGATAAELVGLREMVLPSRHVSLGPAVARFAAVTFPPGRPLRDVVLDLLHRIRTELRYSSGSTTVHTTQEQLLSLGAGVCQDFAHLMIAALRVHGVPARYASGYLETRPRPGRPKLRGADASHAWVSVWLPGHGWVEVDPTNDKLVDDAYVLLGWGRDYDDVPPVRGVIFTEGARSTLSVSVDLVPSGSEPYL